MRHRQVALQQPGGQPRPGILGHPVLHVGLADDDEAAADKQDGEAGAQHRHQCQLTGAGEALAQVTYEGQLEAAGLRREHDQDAQHRQCPDDLQPGREQRQQDDRDPPPPLAGTQQCQAHAQGLEHVGPRPLSPNGGDKIPGLPHCRQPGPQ